MLRAIAIALAVGFPLAVAVVVVLNWTEPGALVVWLSLAGLGLVVGATTALVATEPRSNRRPPGPRAGHHA